MIFVALIVMWLVTATQAHDLIVAMVLIWLRSAWIGRPIVRPVHLLFVFVVGVVLLWRASLVEVWASPSGLLPARILVSAFLLTHAIDGARQLPVRFLARFSRLGGRHVRAGAEWVLGFSVLCERAAVLVGERLLRVSAASKAKYRAAPELGVARRRILLSSIGSFFGNIADVGHRLESLRRARPVEIASVAVRLDRGDRPLVGDLVLVALLILLADDASRFLPSWLSHLQARASDLLGAN